MPDDRKVTVHLPHACATNLTQIAEHEGRTLAGELLWLALKRVQRKTGSAATSKGKDDDEVTVRVRMPRELADGLRVLADQEDRTLGAEVRRLIRERVSAAPAAEPDPFTDQ